MGETLVGKVVKEEIKNGVEGLNEETVVDKVVKEGIKDGRVEGGDSSW